MTFLLVCQAAGRVLAVSDLKVTFTEEGKEPKIYAAEKFRRNKEGDLIAYEGRMHSNEIEALESTPLEVLRRQAFSTLPGIRKGLARRIFAVDVRAAQAYSSEENKPLIATEEGYTTICGLPKEGAYNLQQRIIDGRAARSKKDLERIALQTEFFLLDEEKINENIGGCISYFIQPGKVRVYRVNRGCLQDAPEAVMQQGMLFYQEPI